METCWAARRPSIKIDVDQSPVLQDLSPCMVIKKQTSKPFLNNNIYEESRVIFLGITMLRDHLAA